jgi:hypothetical protein
MPVQIEINHPDRLVVGIGRGDVSVQEYQQFLADLVSAQVLHYRKIIDITLAKANTIGRDALLAMEARLSAVGHKYPRGPLAIVASPERMEMAQVFKGLTSGERPIEVFRSIHDARRWLATQPVVERERR